MSWPGSAAPIIGLGRLGTAERLLRDAIEKDADSPEIWNNLGVVLMEKGEINEAAQVFRRAYGFDNGASDAIRDNLRLALAKSEENYYAAVQEQDYKLVRRGSSDYLIRRIPDKAEAEAVKETQKMRRPIFISLCMTGAIALAGCGESKDADVDRAFQSVNVVDESNLNDVMLNVADANEAVSYFQRATGEKPDRIDLRRGLAKSLVRAKRSTEAVSAWKSVVAHEDVTNEDRVEYADALIRNNEWKRADESAGFHPPDP